MRRPCDVYGQWASYRGRGIENGRIRDAELCANHYEQMTDQPDTLKRGEYARGLSDLARRVELDPVTGGVKNISLAIEVLARWAKNNPALIGELGVGKAAPGTGRVSGKLDDQRSAA